MTSLKLLLVEDSIDDALLLVRELELSGYDVACTRVETLTAMSDALATRTWDLVIADYAMPTFMGVTAMELARRRPSNAPFVFVGTSSGEDAVVSALKAGADDYVLKNNLKRLGPVVRRELALAGLSHSRGSAQGLTFSRSATGGSAL